MTWTDWLLVSISSVVIFALWIEAEGLLYPRRDNDETEIDRMIDNGQQPGSWEP